MIRRILLNLLLAEAAYVGLLYCMNFTDAATQWYENNRLKHAIEVMEIRHRSLIHRIKVEGLWKRLDMPNALYLH